MTPSGEQVPPAETYVRAVLAPLYEITIRHFAAAMREVDRAHLVVAAESGVLRGEVVRQLAAGLAALDGMAPPVAYDSRYEDFFFVREAGLARVVGPDVAGFLHVGRSRNDLDHTMFRMVLRERIDALREEALSLARGLLSLARRERDTLIVAYTHGQPAQPTTYGHYLSAVLEILLRDIARLAAARADVDLCPLGAAAITTSGFPLDRRRGAALLGFAAPLENSYACIAGVEDLTATYSALEILFLHLGRFVQDLNVWAGFDAGQLRLPRDWVQISSIMPQKRNPVAIEHLRLLASHAAGRARAVVNTLHNTPFTDINDSEAETHVQGYGVFDLGMRMLPLLRDMLQAATVDADRVRRNIAGSLITVTELADTLVRREGVSFRAAHGIAGSVAQALLGAGGGPQADGYQMFRLAFERSIGRAPALDEAGFHAALSPENFVAVRGNLGGPAAAALEAACGRYGEAIAALEAVASADAARLRAASASLDAAMARLAGR
jgi:argininosuccinate lyase